MEEAHGVAVPAFNRTRDLVAAGLIAGVAAIGSWIALPVGGVPVTLQTFAVFLAALLLTPAWAAASMSTFLLLGAIGLPVFAGGKGGLGVLVGPTGGYLIGFVAGAAAGALVRTALERRGVAQTWADASTVAVTLACIYVIGAVQLAVVADLSLAGALALGVAPFVLFDAAKGAAAIAVAAGVRKVVSRP
jgi:biotin transport system substrate-specific component